MDSNNEEMEVFKKCFRGSRDDNFTKFYFLDNHLFLKTNGNWGVFHHCISRIHYISLDIEILAMANPKNRNKNWHCVHTLVGHKEGISSIVFCLEDQKLVSGSWDGTIQIWSLKIEQVINTFKQNNGEILEAVRHIAVSPDGKYLVSCSASGTIPSAIKIWDMATGRELHHLPGYSSESISIAITPDSQTLISGSDSYYEKPSLRLWNIKTGQELCILTQYVESIDDMTVSSDGEILASASGCDIKIFNLKTRQEIYTLKNHQDTVYSIAMSRDRAILASSSMDKTIKIWDLATGEEILTIPVDTDCMIALSPDGQTVASFGRDERIRFWEVSTGQEICTIAEHPTEGLALAFSPDGQMLATGGEDATIKIWHREL
ncbi:WD40 repeat domain-containing protein [Lusitaniella coriacea]|uniref:WD40 repeat domain-containing protein n=1 Tax=Lusitaniella coriacea TaxID=1983105 RepID=UPI003CE7E4EA